MAPDSRPDAGDARAECIASIDGCLAGMKASNRAMHDYQLWCRALHGAACDAPLTEARHKLDQLSWLLTEIRAHIGTLLEATRSVEAPAPGNPDPASGMPTAEELVWLNDLRLLGEASIAIEVLTESFYWVAHRALLVTLSLPGLRGFRADGIRDVRNHLLAHPESANSGVVSTSSGFSFAAGPQVKPVRSDPQAKVWVDAGLFANALEFSANLNRSVATAVSAPDPAGALGR